MAKWALKQHPTSSRTRALAPTRTQQAQRAGKAMAQAEALCRARGARLTPIRRKVLEALYATHKPWAPTISPRSSGPRGRRLAPITVYRALDFLIEQGFVHRLASQNAYIASPNEHEEQESVTFLICEKCGGVDEMTSPGLVGGADRAAGRAGLPADGQGPRDHRPLLALPGLTRLGRSRSAPLRHSARRPASGRA